jgi:hypothetical protein
MSQVFPFVMEKPAAANYSQHAADQSLAVLAIDFTKAMVFQLNRGNLLDPLST